MPNAELVQNEMDQLQNKRMKTAHLTISVIIVL